MKVSQLDGAISWFLTLRYRSMVMLTRKWQANRLTGLLSCCGMRCGLCYGAHTGLWLPFGWAIRWRRHIAMRVNSNENVTGG